jgi:adenine-specific DNA-methyltransferase
MSDNQCQRLELTWIGKGNQPRLEPRILIEDPEKSYGDKNTENMLIYGDNLLALKALEQDFTGKIKCIYIDPPYNTGNAFEHYDDGLEHSIWLTMMRDRLAVLKNLLSEKGSIWISIDDNEVAYLRVLMDELFGRSNFIATCIWQKVYSPKSSAKFLSDMHDYIVAYAKNINLWQRNLLLRTEKQNKAYKNFDNDSRGPWKAGDLSARNYYSEGRYSITCPSGRIIEGPPQGMYWRVSKKKFLEMDNDRRIWWGKNGNNVPAIKRFLSEVLQGIVPQTLWFYEDVGHNQSAKQHLKKLLPEVQDLFITPKPEGLIERIFQISSEPNDWVLDSFLGSGTTAAVANKMKRKWIGIELGDHCHTHCLPRLKKVVDGSDQGGISKSVNWKGGGGFKYYYLAPSLLKKDKYGNWIIEERYNADMLAAAMAKHESFKYCPDEQVYWKQGKSTEKDFIFTTTQFVTVEILDDIHEQMQPEESLLICCTSFQEDCKNRHININVKKIPNILLGRCEFGKEDYSLNIINIPSMSTDPESAEIASSGPAFEREPAKEKKTSRKQMNIYD